MINKTRLAHRTLDKITRITMLLCLSRHSYGIFLVSFPGF
jgi:hypothetical protein